MEKSPSSQHENIKSKRRSSRKEKKDPQSRRRKTKGSKEHSSNQMRIHEINSLIKHMLPFTINGQPSSAILKQKIDQKSDREKENAYKGPKNKNRISRKKKIAILQNFITHFIKSQPNDVLYLSFSMPPSDPDFPYELDSLKFSLAIPSLYPKDIKSLPSIVVLNSEIPKGFAVNIEGGFRKVSLMAKGALKDEEIELVEGSSLLSQILTLDKYLEYFLKQEKKETIKFVSFKRTLQNVNASLNPSPVDHSTTNLDLDPKTRLAAATTPLVPTGQRKSLVGEMITKFPKDVKPFQGGNACTVYKVILPLQGVLESASYIPSIPSVWHKNKAVELMLHVPLDYPISSVKINLLPQFSENLAKRYHEESSLADIRNCEKNIEENFASCTFKSISLIYILNFLCNYLGFFCLESDAFREISELIL